MKKALLWGGVIFILIQFIRPEIEVKKWDKSLEIEAPKKVKEILKRSCYDCHSFETKIPWYDRIVPVYWFVARHVKFGREALNFSTYKKEGPFRVERLKRAIHLIKRDLMPLASYLIMHKEARLSKKDKKILIDFFKNELRKKGIEYEE